MRQAGQGPGFMGIARRINVDELCFDLVIALAAPFFYRLMVREGNAAIVFPRAFFFLLYIFVPFYVSVLMHGYNRLSSGSRALRSAFIAFGALTIFTFYYSLFMDSVPAMNRLGIVHGPNLWWYLAGLFCIMFGTIAASVDFTGDEGPGPTPVHMVLIVVMISATVLASIFTVMTRADDPRFTWVIGVAVFFGGLVVIVASLSGIFLSAAAVTDRYENEKWFSTAGILTRDLFLPVVAASVLSVWEAVTLTATDAGPGSAVLALVLGGIVPLRLLMAAAPPWRPVNTAIAVIAIAIHVWAVSSH